MRNITAACIATSILCTTAISEGEPTDLEARLIELAESRGITVDYEELGVGPEAVKGDYNYVSCLLRINTSLPWTTPRGTRVSTFLHELGHALDPDIAVNTAGTWVGDDTGQKFADTVMLRVEYALGLDVEHKWIYGTVDTPEVAEAVARLLAGLNGTSHETWCKF